MGAWDGIRASSEEEECPEGGGSWLSPLCCLTLMPRGQVPGPRTSRPHELIGASTKCLKVSLKCIENQGHLRKGHRAEGAEDT